MTTIAMVTPAAPGDVFGACIEPLLRALRWRGTPRQLAEAGSAGAGMDLHDLCNTMANLGFHARTEKTRLGDIDARLLPCLFVPDVGEPRVVLNQDADAHLRGTACFFTFEASATAGAAAGGWLRGLLRRFEGRFAQVAGVSFVLSLLALAPAFFVQAVYDRVLATQDRGVLIALAVGIGLVLACDTLLRLLRGAALAQVGARMDYLIGSAACAKLLSLPLARLEKSGVGAQIARLREFESLRQVFTGPLALALFELLFMLVYVLAIAIVGGWLALVPVVLALLLVGGGLAIVRYARRSAGQAAPADHQALLIEMLAHMRSIKAAAAEAIWLERFRERSAQAAFAHLRQARVAALADNIAQAVNLVSGAATLAVGAVIALDGSLSVGALIASMALVWRALAPAQALFVAMTRVEEIAAAASGIDQLMALPCESATGRQTTTRGRRFAGRITFERVVQRYTAHHEPALAGVSFDIRPGEIVAITGGNGSGKSSIVKLIAGLYPAQAGSVLIDGVDARQLDVGELRRAIAYLPQRAELFAGTIADNLRLCAPAASDEALHAACERAGAAADIAALPEGLATKVGEQLAATLVRKLALARAWLVDAPIVLLDEPVAANADGTEDPLLQQLEALRGRATVLLVTHNPAYVRVADRVIVLRQGAVVHDGSPLELMARLPGAAR